MKSSKRWAEDGSPSPVHSSVGGWAPLYTSAHDAHPSMPPELVLAPVLNPPVGPLPGPDEAVIMVLPPAPP
jgi:hypothetical protein